MFQEIRKESFVSGVALFALLAAASPEDGVPGGPSHQALFVDAPGWVDPAAPQDPTIVRSRPIDINLQRLAEVRRDPGEILELDLFDDASFTAILERVENLSPDGYVLTGHLSGEEHSSFTLVSKQGVVMANIRVPGRNEYYQIRFLADGTHVIRQINDNTIADSCDIADGGRERCSVPSDGSTALPACRSAMLLGSGGVRQRRCGIVFIRQLEQAETGHAFVEVDDHGTRTGSPLERSH